MKNLSSDTQKKQGGGFLLFLVVILASAMVGIGWFYFRDMDAPLVAVGSLDSEGGAQVVGKKSEIKVRAADAGSGIRRMVVTATKNSDSFTLLDKTYGSKPAEVEETVTLENVKLPDGRFEIGVVVDDASYFNFAEGNRKRETVAYTLDTTPPRISVRGGTIYVKRGGTGVVAYKLSETVSSSGVRVGDMFFPGYRQENGDYLCFYAFPYLVTLDKFAPAVVATDTAGNERTRRFSLQPKDHAFRKDTIRLPDSFLNRKMPDFENAFPGEMTQLERFLKVNREMRKENRAALLMIGRKTAPGMLWKGSFQRMKGAPRAGFGDQRTYKYADEVVDHQTHLGVDIASLKHYPIPAGNAGVVVFAGDFGIYGQCVIIDHGMGLQTLYSHLSSIAVQTGDALEKGAIIGKTGMTGLAGGDHLHFGVLVSGVPVSPVEWWDGGWIRDNITSKIN